MSKKNHKVLFFIIVLGLVLTLYHVSVNKYFNSSYQSVGMYVDPNDVYIENKDKIYNKKFIDKRSKEIEEETIAAIESYRFDDDIKIYKTLEFWHFFGFLGWYLLGRSMRHREHTLKYVILIFPALALVFSNLSIFQFGGVAIFFIIGAQQIFWRNPKINGDELN